MVSNSFCYKYCNIYYFPRKLKVLIQLSLLVAVYTHTHVYDSLPTEVMQYVVPGRRPAQCIATGSEISYDGRVCRTFEKSASLPCLPPIISHIII